LYREAGTEAERREGEVEEVKEVFLNFSHLSLITYNYKVPKALPFMLLSFNKKTRESRVLFFINLLLSSSICLRSHPS